MMDVLRLSAFDLAKKIRDKELTSTEIVQAHIDQIKKVNKSLNAMVETRFEEALKEAAHIDELAANGKIPAEMSLAGVPCTIKEMIAIDGMKSTQGSIHKKKDRRDYNASVVDRIQNAGAIILGTTNVPEVGFWFECDNPVYGETNNPYDTHRTSGGSSGGEASLIAALGSPFGIGSDIGGSIRIPAGFCGIYGHKPSDKLIPMTGHAPLTPQNASEYTGHKYPFTVMGPMSRNARDLYPLMNLLIGADSYDLGTKKNFKLKPLAKDLSKIKIYHIATPKIYLASETDKDIALLVKNAARYLEQLGAEVHELPADFFEKGFAAWQARAQSMGNKFKNVLSAGKKIDYLKEFALLLTEKRNYTLPGLLTAFLEDKQTHRGPPDLQVLRELKQKYDQTLGDNGVLLFPVHPRVAFKKGASFLRPFDFIYTGVFNALGAPATALPISTKKIGNSQLPISIQVSAKEDNDHLTLGVTEILAEAFTIEPPQIH